VRAIWKGAVSFGLVNVPVRLYSATENHDLSFHQVRRSDGSRIRYKRVAQTDGEEVAYKDIAKAYETADGRTVVLTDEDFDTLPSRASKEITVERFVPTSQIDPILLDKAYYIEPDSMGAKAYGLLREALRETDRVAVVTVAVRTRMTMAALRVKDDVIVLQTLLVDSMAGDFEPDAYEDDYQQAVEALVQAKIEGGEVTEAPEEEEEDDGQVVDLLAALQRSVDRAKAARGESSEDAGSGGADQGSTAKKSSGSKGTTKKATAKKTTAKKTTAKKTAAKKSTAGKKAG
jgi:DNA end-binding protein Ku